MKAKEIMIKDVYKVNEHDSVRSVITFFIDHKISGLPIVNDTNELVGYISDGDIMRNIGKHKDLFVDYLYTVTVFKGDDIAFNERIKNILDLNVMSIAKRKITIVHPETNIEDIAATLGEKQFKKLPVVKNNKLIGIISRGDVVRHAFTSIL